ncbi:Crp/Fnr family transcriptional regulator [Vibrio sp. 10N.222.51.C12]|uniref:Crp/Fnr family transcriptional regulator n=1 Tax=unclassified Vibrio TaxID=2614977 RepID=UPI000C84FF3B|nr:Crp/Fnr family transcriptional regulator [Vibrio sp. 10N.286.48.B7]PMH78817.1 hypothetical protein BCU58_07640 [Vibrio sp. 10N.286.48.B7]
MYGLSACPMDDTITMLNEIHTNLHHSLEPVVLEKRQVVYHNGRPAHGFYYVQAGLIGLYQVSEVGKESLLRIYGPGSFFGYRSLFTQQKYPATARSMLDSHVLKINVNDFKTLDSFSPNLACYLMKGVCTELGEAEKRLMQFTAFSAKKRILDALFHLFTLYPSYPWTYREIGEFSGTDTSTVIRYCKYLKNLGVLDNSSRKPRPLDMSIIEHYRQTLIKE